MQQITSSSDKLTKKNIITRVSDVPGGLSLAMTGLIVGSIVPEASPLSKPVNGVRSVCKQAVLLTGSTTTVFQVETATNPFKVGENLMQEAGGAAYAITAVVDNGDGTSAITVGTALESATAGTFLYPSVAVGAAAGALSAEADVILKEGYQVPSAEQVIVILDAQVRADVHADVIGPLYLATMPGIIEINY